MRRMEDLLLGMDKTDERDNNGRYLQSRLRDVRRENDIPPSWKGESRVQLIEKLEKLALEYGKRHHRLECGFPTEILLSGVASQSSAAQGLGSAV